MHISYEPNTVGFLDMTFGPKWDYIPLTKNYIENFLLINVIDKIDTSKISMSTSELLENAVKYSSRDGIRMIIKKDNNNKEIVLTIYNFVKEKDAEALIETIENMNRQDPLKYYIQKMKESVANESGHAGLGLARINYEGEAKLEIEYFPSSETVKITAIFNIKN